VGGDNLFVKTREMITHAKHDYVGIWGKFGLTTILANGITAAMIAATKRNVRVRLIAEIDASNLKYANHISRYVEMRRSQDLLFYIDIADGKQIVFGSAFAVLNGHEKKAAQRKLELWTSNPDFVRGMYAMFERLWKACPRYRPGDELPAYKRPNSKVNGLGHKGRVPASLRTFQEAARKFDQGISRNS
jgi:hypothetical protein